MFFCQLIDVIMLFVIEHRISTTIISMIRYVTTDIFRANHIINGIDGN